MNGPCPGIPDERTCRKRGGARGALLATASALALAACQSYEPLPLDALEAGGRTTDWPHRAPEVESLRAFLERLELDVRDRAGELDLTDGIELDEGRVVALVLNPRLRLARRRVEEEVAGRANAGLWVDPQLSLSVLRITQSVPIPLRLPSDQAPT